MNLKKDYTDLYRHWLAEFDQKELTPFFKEDFNSYRNSVNKIKTIELQDNDAIKKEILQFYKDHFEFLFEDLLKVRKIKIMNTALVLQEINLELLLEPEKLLYQNLISSIKGYDKLKKLSVLEDHQGIDLGIRPSIFPSDIETSQIELGGDHDTKNQENNLYNEEEGMLDDSDVETVIESDFDEDYNYIVIRFVKDTPPLVGIDLKNYGPFNANDIASMPYKNAIILINEKFAEKVDLS